MQKLNSSPDKDDSLADFKSPKLERVPPATVKPKILNDKRAKKSSSKSKTLATNRKKENAARRTTDQQDQPSIESSLFRASITATKAGHTCPLCMKFFADTAAGTAHSKNCATKNNVSTKKLLAAVALQERQSHERIAIGLPAGPLIQPKTKTPRRSRDPVVIFREIISRKSCHKRFYELNNFSNDHVRFRMLIPTCSLLLLCPSRFRRTNWSKTLKKLFCSPLNIEVKIRSSK